MQLLCKSYISVHQIAMGKILRDRGVNQKCERKLTLTVIVSLRIQILCVECYKCLTELCPQKSIEITEGHDEPEPRTLLEIILSPSLPHFTVNYFNSWYIRGIIVVVTGLRLTACRHGRTLQTVVQLSRFIWAKNNLGLLDALRVTTEAP